MAQLSVSYFRRATVRKPHGLIVKFVGPRRLGDQSFIEDTLIHQNMEWMISAFGPLHDDWGFWPNGGLIYFEHESHAMLFRLKFHGMVLDT
jgi:hypothetical protein